MRDNNRMIRLALAVLAGVACLVAGVVPAANAIPAHGTAPDLGTDTNAAPDSGAPVAAWTGFGPAPWLSGGPAATAVARRARWFGGTAARAVSYDGPHGPGSFYGGRFRGPGHAGPRHWGGFHGYGGPGGYGYGGYRGGAVPASAESADAGPPITIDPREFGAEVYSGHGFDTCTAPDLDTMRAWRSSSPYGAVGVYIGGNARSCAQPRLTRSWVRSVSAMGWKLIPIYVGSQSPCVTAARKRQYAIDPADARIEGTQQAEDAVRAATALGMAAESPVYLDVEAYDTDSASCTDPVLDFTAAWSDTLRDRGYLSGFYSSADSGIEQIEGSRAAGSQDVPDVMWFAHWNVAPTIYGEPALPAGYWRPHRRIHQYTGNTSQTYGGYTLNVDQDLIDAPVAIVP
ncbi:DUF1906 domain-containing protein [Streptantibioticus parmotrematis]|nr:DUF1906 domain-containing protein [Streptantibioticus parmotrematis]